MEDKDKIIEILSNNFFPKEIVEENEDIFSLFLMDDKSFELLSGVLLKTIDTELTPEKCKEVMGDIIEEYTVFELEKEVNRFFIEIDEIATDNNKAKINFIKELINTVYNKILLLYNNTDKVSLPVELCREGAIIPKYAHELDAGLDVFALEDYEINPGETVLIPTGLKIDIPEGYEIQVRPKSGRALTTKLRIANTPGTIDSGYKDEIGVIVENIESPIAGIRYDFADGKINIESILHGKSYFIGKGEKFAQLVVSKVVKGNFVSVSKISSVNDRKGGFGSTGVK